jgi:HlyD family secretion protein
MTVSIEIEVADRANAVVVPAAAVREPQSAAPWVLVVDAGRARRVPVKLGARTASQIEITEGLAPATEVILTPGTAAGDRVRPARH